MNSRRIDSTLSTAAALGALSGLRSMAAPALLAHELQSEAVGESAFDRLFTSDAFARLLLLLAGGEMVADKTPLVPDRINKVPLLGRAALGCLSAAAFAAHRRERVMPSAAIGAGAALATTFTAFHLRRLATHELRVPDRIVGLVEDGLVLAASRIVAERLDGSAA